MSYPNPEGQAVSDALTWAKGLAQMSPASLRKLADDYFEKSGSVDRTEFKRVAGSSEFKDAPEAYMHRERAKTIVRFAGFKEAGKR